MCDSAASNKLEENTAKLGLINLSYGSGLHFLDELSCLLFGKEV